MGAWQVRVKLQIEAWHALLKSGQRDHLDRIEADAAFLAAQDKDKNGLLIEDEFPEGPLQDRFSIIDADKDGLPDLDPSGLFKSSTGAALPYIAPFSLLDWRAADNAPGRDADGRVWSWSSAGGGSGSRQLRQADSPGRMARSAPASTGAPSAR